MEQLADYAVIRSLKRFRDRYFPDRSKLVKNETKPNLAPEPPEPGFLDILPVDLQFVIMTFLSPVDLCRLGASSRYWRAMIRDPILWKYFLLRDMPYWPSIDHLTMPQLELYDVPQRVISEDENLSDAQEVDETGTELKCDFMSEYLRACPHSRKQWLPSRPAYEVLTSFLQSLVPSSEPRYAMFGPGIEQLEVSLVTRLMHSPHVLPVLGTPQRQINGVGSGISYVFNNQHRFNILTLYSTNRAERERARMNQQDVTNKLFTIEEDDSGCPVYSPSPQVQQVCQVVDGFIYVANAEPGRSGGQSEVAQIQAVMSSAKDSTSPRPLLVLSCVSRGEASRHSSLQNVGSSHRTACVYMAQRLGLTKLPNPWMVQDTVAESLSGLLDGISWLLRCSGVKLYTS
ncbi:F-box only protein 4 [Cynoglossus semilaevis]|uniref:F-box protein 4 n=1 Tax=Cynoglossus semilaevis TaxID=244447 RepID=A0A3P8WIK0_CYNSE|nr:F-box only protein 4 [Cynoglossus semilaevis]